MILKYNQHLKAFLMYEFYCTAGVCLLPLRNCRCHGTCAFISWKRTTLSCSFNICPCMSIQLHSSCPVHSLVMRCFVMHGPCQPSNPPQSVFSGEMEAVWWPPSGRLLWTVLGLWGAVACGHHQEADSGQPHPCPQFTASKSTPCRIEPTPSKHL